MENLITNIYASSEDMQYMGQATFSKLMDELYKANLSKDAVPVLIRINNLFGHSARYSVKTAIDSMLDDGYRSLNALCVYNMACDIFNLSGRHKLIKKRRDAIDMDGAIIDNDIATVQWCYANTDSEFSTAYIYMGNVEQYFIENMSEGVIDFADHEGNHVQQEWKAKFEELRHDEVEDVIKAYIEWGGEMVI